MSRDRATDDPATPIPVLINPAAGKDKPVLAILDRVFKEAGRRWRAVVLDGPGAAERVLSRLQEHDALPPLIAVSGGDGSVSAVAALLQGTETSLAVLPGGTGNVVAQELGLPLDYEAAARALFLGPTRPHSLDLVDCGGKISVLRVGLGADARLMQAASREAKNAHGWAAYLKAAIDQVSKNQRDVYRIALDGETFEREALTVLVLNIGRLGRGGAVLSSDISPFDGNLDVLVIRRGAMDAVSAIVRGVVDSGSPLPFLGPVDSGEPVELASARHVRITCENDVDLQLDGDTVRPLASGCELELRVRPAALRVEVPLAAG